MDIEEIVNIRQVQYVGIEATVFLCRATVGKRPWLFELKYTIRTHTLRMEDECHQLLRVDSEEIVNIRQVQYVGIEATVFLCRATVGKQPWLFELKYTIRTHTWCLMRRVC